MQNPMESDKKILVVEDDEFLMKIYEIKFKQEGHLVIKAVNGEQGVDLAKSEKPDLILLDLILPKKSGFEVLDEIKADPETKDIPIIIISNLGQDEDVKKGLDKGASDYIVKANSTIEEFMEKIGKYLK